MGVMQLGGGAMGPNIRLRSKQRKNTRWEQDTRPKAQNLLLTMAGRNLEIYKQHDFRKGRSPQAGDLIQDNSLLAPESSLSCYMAPYLFSQIHVRSGLPSPHLQTDNLRHREVDYPSAQLASCTAKSTSQTPGMHFPFLF